MKDRLDRIIDECIDRLNRGESIDSCLKDFPEHRETLEPVLTAMLKAKTAYSFAPSDQAKNLHRQRFNAALALAASREISQRKQTLANRIMGWAKVWAPVTAAIVIAIVAYFGLRPAPVPPTIIASPNPEGNFAFLISDEVNDIGDFQSLDIKISSVTLHLGADGEKIIEFDPEIQVVSLTNLQGDRAQEVWRGDVPDGEYNKIVLEVSQVSGVLQDSEQEIEIKLPSGKLQISKPFVVSSGEVTSFVYDLTVVKDGNSGKYNLKPQIGQSGADQEFTRVEPEKQQGNSGKQEDQPENNGESQKTNKGKKPSGMGQ